MNPLKRYREQILISKTELARKAGLSVLTIDRIEKGGSCRLDTKKKILLALDLKLSEKNKIFGSKK
jgi:DNA-binding XRE family transcriptional regulator